MRTTKVLMGMPITVEVVDPAVTENILDKIFSYFTYVDEKFSTYKDNSEINKINRGELAWEEFSSDMQTVFRLSQQTKQATNGFFDILTPQGLYDPSGLVKGWAIWQAALILKNEGFEKFFIEAGGDIQTQVKITDDFWTVGIRNPFNRDENVKILQIKNEGVATSGTYIRGQHIYNPHQNEGTNPEKGSSLHRRSAPASFLQGITSREVNSTAGNKLSSGIYDIVSLTVIGPNIYEADRFATAAFAMGKEGINFIEQLNGFEGYIIDKDGIATMTSNFNKYVC